MQELILYKNKGIAFVDEIDYGYLTSNQWNWCFSTSNGYALRYWNEQDKRGTTFMHRVVMTRILGKPIARGMQVDHINHNRLDNRRDNLRVISASENQWYKRVPSNNRSGYKGVSPTSTGKFDAYIKVHGKQFSLGRFENAIEAAFMYDVASRDLHGEFSYPNFPNTFIPPHLEEKWSKILNRQDDLERNS